MLISATNIISKSFDLYKKHAILYIKYMLIMLIPTGLVAIMSSIVGPSFLAVASFGFAWTIVLYVFIMLFGSVASIWISLALIRAIRDNYLGQAGQPIKTELKNSSKLLLAAIVASILVSFITIGGFILLIVPGIIFAVWFSFSIYGIAIEEHDPILALKDSKNLVFGRWWAVLWRIVGPAIFFAFIAMAIQWLVSIPVNMLDNTMLENTYGYYFIAGFLALVNLCVTLIITPLSTAAPTILYLELKKTPIEKNNPSHPDHIDEISEPPVE